MNAINISSLFAYPLKSCRAQSLQEGQILFGGLAGDRTYAVIDDTGQMLTAREHPELLTIEAVILDENICFSRAGVGTQAPSTSMVFHPTWSTWRWVHNTTSISSRLNPAASRSSKKGS